MTLTNTYTKFGSLIVKRETSIATKDFVLEKRFITTYSRDMI